MDSTRPIRALMRGLDALTVLNSRDGATVSEIAQESRLPRTTVYRILETLCTSGFVFRDPADERYRLTILVRTLSAGFDDESWVTQLAKPTMQALGDAITWPVCLATLSGTKLIVRHATDYSIPLPVERYTAGLQLPLLTTSSGRVYLAHCAPAQRDTLLDILARSGKEEDKAARLRPELLRLLDEIKSHGYATAARTRRFLDELSISVPLPLNERSLAVLTVRFLASALPLKTGVERFLPRLRQSAARIAATFVEKQAEPRAAIRAPKRLLEESQ